MRNDKYIIQNLYNIPALWISNRHREVDSNKKHACQACKQIFGCFHFLKACSVMLHQISTETGVVGGLKVLAGQKGYCSSMLVIYIVMMSTDF